ncbi:MAG: DUF2628 domain-containing protein [Cyanobacteria bacterium P01_G01_bin.49]
MTVPTEQEIRAFVGRRSDYYLNRWSTALSGEGDVFSFNQAAFWLAGFWLPYRKMYKITLIFYGIIAAESLLEYIFFVGILKYQEPPVSLNFAVGIGSGVICGIYANRWYYWHTCENIEQLRRLNLSEESLNEALKKRGGTNWITSIAFMIMFILVLG